MAAVLGEGLISSHARAALKPAWVAIGTSAISTPAIVAKRITAR